MAFHQLIRSGRGGDIPDLVQGLPDWAQEVARVVAGYDEFCGVVRLDEFDAEQHYIGIRSGIEAIARRLVSRLGLEREIGSLLTQLDAEIRRSLAAGRPSSGQRTYELARSAMVEWLDKVVTVREPTSSRQASVEESESG